MNSTLNLRAIANEQFKDPRTLSAHSRTWRIEQLVTITGRSRENRARLEAKTDSELNAEWVEVMG